jgi:membrane protease YdiL (CAAX protease family)
MNEQQTEFAEYPPVVKYLLLAARIVALIIIIALLSLAIMAGSNAIISALGISLLDQNMLIPQSAMMVAAIISIFIFRQFIDRKSFISIGLSLKEQPRSFLVGSAIAIAIISLGFVILLLSEVIEIASVQVDISYLLTTFVLFIAVSVFEEMVFRGYILNNMMDVMNKYLALILSSLLFAALHLGNSGMTFIAFTNLFLAGVLLGSAYIFTRDLWLPIGMHLFWNYVQGPIFGFNVSGETINEQSLIIMHTHGDDIITGGAFGFEGSVVCSALSIVAILLVILYCRKRYTKQKENIRTENIQ